MTARVTSGVRVLAVLLIAMAAIACDRTQSQRDFASADEAIQALMKAATSDSTRALVDVLGKESERALDSGDPVQDRSARERFVREYQSAHALSVDDTGATTLLVGPDKWPFPFPLVESHGRWHFDGAAGADEIVNRRVGANELSTIQSCLAFVDAQREYFRRNPQRDSLLHFASKLVSTQDRKDGLYWPSDEEAPSPLGEGFARAQAEGYFEKGVSKHEPFRGYLYRLLTAQGPHAAGGAYSYLVDDKMLGGFALLAIPAEYGRSGVMSFMVNHDGVVHSKDLGPDTHRLAREIQTFDPDPSWRREAAIE